MSIHRILLGLAASLALTLAGCGETPESDLSPTEVGALSDVPSGAVVFRAYGNHSADLYRINVDGSGLVRLTDTESTEFQGRWSPDGRRIAFSWSARDNRPYSNVYAMSPDGRDVRVVTSGETWDLVESWSPDGTRLLFTRGGVGPVDYWVVNADGSSPVKILPFNECWSDFDWSPEGTQITGCTCKGEKCRLFIIDADGKGSQVLEDMAGEVREPKWSPDGGRILFIHRQPEAAPRVMVRDIEGGVLDVAYSGPIAESGIGPSAVWLRDGRIAISTGEEIIVVAADGSDREVIATGQQICCLALSPGRDRLAYGSYREGNAGLHILSLESREVRTLPSVAAKVDWSPDGQQLLFSANYDRVDGLYWISASGREMGSIATAVPGRTPDHERAGLDTLIPGCRKPEDEESASCLSPDGHRELAVRLPRADEREMGAKDQLIVTDLETGEEIDITPPGLRLMYARPSWSPDATRAVIRAHEGDHCSLYVVDVDLKTASRLVSVRSPTGCICATDEDVSAAWSSDGEYIYYTKGAILGEGCAPGFLYRVRVDGTGEKQLADLRIGSILGFAP